MKKITKAASFWHVLAVLALLVGVASTSALQSPTLSTAASTTARTSPSCNTGEGPQNGTHAAETTLSAHQVYTADTLDSIKSELEEHQTKPLKILFLSSDTGGGHRASAESLARQFQELYPGSTYDLLDVWTHDGILPYKSLVNSYKHLSANPLHWKIVYHFSNTAPNGFIAQKHSTLFCERKIRKRIASYDPDVVISVHPAMQGAPRVSTRRLSREHGKHIPFFTVVTDLGSGHGMWFQKNVDKVYVASDRMHRLAKGRGRTPDEKIVMTGLPIRYDFAVQSDNMGDRTQLKAKAYQKEIRQELGLNPDKKMVLVMGGGEGVGSLSDIVNELYVKFAKQGIDATICVVCGRNEALKTGLEERDWDAVIAESEKPKKKAFFRFRKRNRSKDIQAALQRAEDDAKSSSDVKGDVNVVGLGFVTNMAEYMVAADILVSKAGPGTIAEAASVGLPIMMTSFLPGQEAGNVEVVLEAGFGDYCEDPDEIAREVACWMKDDGLLASMSSKASGVGQPQAAADIASDIGNITLGWIDVNLASNGGERTSVLDSSL